MRISPILWKGSASSSRWIARQSRDPYVKSRSSTKDGNGPVYRSRSSFKLLSIANKYPLFANPPTASPAGSGSGSENRSRVIVDLGAAPGGWTQVVFNLLRSKSKNTSGGGTKIFALDILDIEPIPNVEILKGDFLSEEIRQQLRLKTLNLSAEQEQDENRGEVERGEEGTGLGMVDCVLSDMMSPMTGNKTRDISLSLQLCAAATVFARDVLRKAKSGEEVRKESGKRIWPGGNLVIKFFAHPDMDEFRSTELDPWFGKVVVEKPKESRAESSEAYWVCLGYKGDPALR